MWVGVQLSTAREGNRLRFFFFFSPPNSRVKQQRAYTCMGTGKVVRKNGVRVANGRREVGRRGGSKKKVFITR